MSKQDDLLFQLQDELRLRLTSNPELKAIFRKIQSGTATLDDTFRYSQISSELLGNFLSEKVSELSPSDREYVCCELLKSRHFDINQRVAEVQRLTDKKNRLNLNPQKATFPTERVQQIAHSLADPTVPIETIQRRADSSVANVGLSFHDDCIQENAKFRSNAGLKCRIVRTTDGKCCKWCTSMAGRWVYGEEPPDVYRRHDNCTCSVTFENGRERQNVRNKKTWEVKEDFQPTVLSREQADELQQQNLQYRGLTNSRNSDIIKDRGKHFGKFRGQIDIPYEFEVPDSQIDKFNQSALNSIIEETGYNREQAQKFQNALIEWLGDDYEEFTKGNRKEQEQIINEGLARMGTYDGVISRGMNFRKQAEYEAFSALEVGDTYSGNTVYAWSSEREVANNYAGASMSNLYSVIIECENNKTAVGIQHISKHGNVEAEVLSPSTAHYVITDKKTINKYDYLEQSILSSNYSAEEKEALLKNIFKGKEILSKCDIICYKVREV